MVSEIRGQSSDRPRYSEERFKGGMIGCYYSPPLTPWRPLACLDSIARTGCYSPSSQTQPSEFISPPFLPLNLAIFGHRQRRALHSLAFRITVRHRRQYIWDSPIFHPGYKVIQCSRGVPRHPRIWTWATHAMAYPRSKEEAVEIRDAFHRRDIGF